MESGRYAPGAELPDSAGQACRVSSHSEPIADGVSWNELKDKPFYLEKTPVVELTKDDFTVNNQDGRFKYMYRSTPKLDWFTSEESIAFEVEIVDTNGRRYTATQDSVDVSIEKDSTDDDREYWYCWSDLFEIVSGVDLDYYDDNYYYKDEWGVLVQYGGIEFSGINIKNLQSRCQKDSRNLFRCSNRKNGDYSRRGIRGQRSRNVSKCNYS